VSGFEGLNEFCRVLSEPKKRGNGRSAQRNAEGGNDPHSEGYSSGTTVKFQAAPSEQSFANASHRRRNESRVALETSINQHETPINQADGNE
jgi:hypothetical protein